MSVVHPAVLPLRARPQAPRGLAVLSRELAEQYKLVARRLLEPGKRLAIDAGVRPGDWVLDVGCGTGLLAAWVAERVGPHGKVIGVDPLPLRVELSAQRAGPRFEPLVASPDDLSALGGASFDVVLLNAVLHWLPNQVDVLREAHRVLRPGGRVAFTAAAREPGRERGTREGALAAWEHADGGGLAAGPPHPLADAEAAALLDAAGFRDVQVVPRDFSDGLTHGGTVLLVALGAKPGIESDRALAGILAWPRG